MEKRFEVCYDNKKSTIKSMGVYHMKITWLGQAGLLLKHNDQTVLIDPYLSDSVAKINPKNKRRVPVDERFFTDQTEYYAVYAQSPGSL